MRIDILDCVNQGVPGGFNEDASGWTAHAAWVVDGATALDGSSHWERTSGRWAATAVNNLLTEVNANGNRPPASDGLDAVGAIKQVVDDLSRAWSEAIADVESSELLPPVCSLGMARLTPDLNRMELVTVGDCAIIWRSSTGGERVMVDTRFAADEAEISRRYPNGGGTSELVARRMDYINGWDGLWVLSTNRQVADALQPMLVEDPDGDLVLIASDGFARAVELPRYGGSWGDLLVDAAESGVASVLERLREAERRELSSINGKLKTSDDATAVLLRVAA